MGAAARPVRTRRPSRRAAEAAGGLIPSAASRAASTKRPGRSAHQAEAPAVVGMASADTEAAGRSASRSCRAKRRRSPSSPRRPKDKKKTFLLRSHHPLTLDPCSNRGGKLASSKLLKQGKLPAAKRARSTDLLPCLHDNNKLKKRNNLHDDAMESIVDCARTDLAICPPDNNRRVCENNLLDYPVCPPDNNIWRDLVNNLLADVAPAAKPVPDSQVDHPACPPDTNNNWRDWANLADGPAGLIAERVLAYDIADYVRFRAVCRPWRQSSTEPRSHSGLDRRFHPWKWAMLREEHAAPDRRSFLNTFTSQCVQVDIPELRDHDLLALTPEGLLVLVHKPQRSTVRLLNPLTRQLTELPPLTTLLPPNQHHNLSQHGIHTYCQAWGSGIASDDSTVVLCFNRLRILGMAKPGDDRWTVLNYNGHGMTTAPLMFAGRFYCVNLSGVMVLEMGADQSPQLKVAAKLSMPVSPMADSVHLVNNSGELMLVHRQLGPQKARNISGRAYTIYRVDLDAGTLFPVKSLGGSAGRAVFMGMRCSLLVSLECFPSGSISADTIYLSFDVCERQQFKVRAYHLIDRSMERTRKNWGNLVPRPYTLADCLSYAVKGL